MRDLALLMVKPDGVHQHLTGSVLTFLGHRGFTALATKDVALTPQLRAQLYATTRTGGRLDWELNAVLYGLGPVTAVLLRGPAEAAGCDSAAAYLSSRLKGHFLPTRAKPDTIRGSLNAMNPIFNLVHASDDEEELAREVPVLFGCSVSEAVSLGVADVQHPARPVDHWRNVGHTVAAFLGGEQVGDATAATAGLSVLGDAGWPMAEPDRRAAFEAVRDARPALQAAVRRDPRCRDAGLPAVIAGHEADLPDFAHFSSSAQALPNPPSVWATYLAYTSLRYLDLCLETPA
ncbi:nucleoside-diphosphate kinase [Actinoplanes sp. NPDC020271]|uniref:nucleoside-diphosphate kinase n=1 Tax=Actinoplanes sp. NPDC020271 TaxID=3363896 RepID=UPI0037B76497